MARSPARSRSFGRCGWTQLHDWLRSFAGPTSARLPARNLLQQGTDQRAVIDILAGQLGGNNLSRVGVHPEMELSPGPTRVNRTLADRKHPRSTRAISLRPWPAI